MDNGTRMLHSFGTLRDQEHNIVQGLNNYQDSLEHQNVFNETGQWSLEIFWSRIL